MIQKKPNDWFDEAEQADFDKSVRKQIEFDTLNPPRLVKNIAWMLSGAIIFGIVFLIVSVLVNLGRILW